MYVIVHCFDEVTLGDSQKSQIYAFLEVTKTFWIL